MIRRLLRVSILALVGLLPVSGFGQSRLLDDFEDIGGWKAVPSEGAKVSITQAPGKSGKALEMDFDLRGAYGYVIIRKEFPLDLPSNYQFTWDMKAESQVNNLEFKIIDDSDNVYWIKKLNVTYPTAWARQRISKNQLTFAWGPNPGKTLTHAAKIELVVSCGTGGMGKVFFDNFRFEPIEDVATTKAKAEVHATSTATGAAPSIDPLGTTMTSWRSAGDKDHESLQFSFNRLKEIGGVVIDWDQAGYASSYDVSLSDDGTEWFKAYSVESGNGGRDYVPLKEGEGRFLRIDFSHPGAGNTFAIKSLSIKDPAFAASNNGFYRAIAADAPSGYYPKYLQDKQSYWTVVGVDGDTKEAMVNEQGQVEVDKSQFSLEPFLYIDGKLITWSDVKTTQALDQGYLPIPSVNWSYKEWLLTVQLVAAGTPGNSILCVKYSLENHQNTARAKLFIAIRPFQVNPPWQSLNIDGGVSHIDSITVNRGVIGVNDKKVIPMTSPTAFGAVTFDQGDITEYLAKGMVPGGQSVRDHSGLASAVLEYDIEAKVGDLNDVYVAVPFHGWQRSPAPAMGMGARFYYSMMYQQASGDWKEKLDKFNVSFPPIAEEVVKTVKSQLGYIMINSDGPSIQPGSRSYERSWIRDGSLTSSALLRTGNTEMVRKFIDWFVTGQFPSGKVPCVMDSHGPDPLPENDSHGELIYAIDQYFRFSHDTTWLREKFDAVVKTVHYIQSQLAARKTDVYKNGTPEQRACYGIMPESISHEGYWAMPRHSYWDDFFTIRGLKDAVGIAKALGKDGLAKEFAALRDTFRIDLYASMRLAMANTKVDYIPGCAELGDFDATSTTVGIYPADELGQIPEPQLHNTFDKYWKFFLDREKNGYVNYTPYETRVIGSFVFLGQKDRAEEAVKFFMNDRRPHEWNHWAEVVWHDPLTPKFIGDMPHTWVGSDFVRSIINMLWYEREDDDAIVLAGGIPDSWVRDTTGIRAYDMPTYYGKISYSLKPHGKKVIALFTGTIDVKKHLVVMKSPLSTPLRGLTVDGKKVAVPKSGEAKLTRLPAPNQKPLIVEFLY